jgi:hypothetical protein
MIRQILNTLEMLTESTGLAGRKPGDAFKNPEGEQMVFNSIQFFPEGGGKYTKEELDDTVNQVLDGIEVQWTNSPSAKTGGFAIASFSSDKGEQYFGKYFEQIKPNLIGNFFPNKIGEYTFAGKSAAKAQAGLSPQDLLSDKIDLTSDDIINQLATSLGTDNPLYVVAQRIANGEKLPIHFNAPADASFSAFRDYFCEILQPMALQTGNYTGNAGEAAEIFMDGTFEDTLITFDTSKTAGLSDSVLTNPQGKIIKVSTKGGAGAKASVKNLLDSVEEMKQTPAGKRLIRKHQETISLLEDIKREGQAGSPLMLGVKFGIINAKEAIQIEDLKNMAPINLDDIEEVNISSRLKKMALNRGTKTPENTSLYFHLIAEVAHKAADKVNDATDFPKAASDILNNGALVQVYTKAKEGKDTWILQEFNTVYPGDSIKGVYLSAGKTYYSTGIKGNFTFKIDKGTGVPKEDAEETQPTQPTSTSKKPELDLNKAAKQIATGRTTRSEKQKPEVGDVGRAKRK